MKSRITIDDIYVYYDHPQVFTGVDTEGNKYLCLCEEYKDDHDVYLGIRISESRLTSLLQHDIDLLFAFTHPDIAGYYIIHGGETFDIVEKVDTVPNDYLPDPCYFI